MNLSAYPTGWCMSSGEEHHARCPRPDTCPCDCHTKDNR